jgi:hypothetical protein
LDDRTLDKQIDNLVDALMGPIIVFPGGWEDTLPDWIKGAIQIERLAQLMKGEETATDAEACAYLYTASLTNPMDRDWTQVYLHIAGKVISRNKGEEIPEDIKVDSLDDYQMGLLRDLKHWIYERRVKHRQEKQRAEKARAVAEAKARAPEQLKLGV